MNKQLPLQADISINKLLFTAWLISDFENKDDRKSSETFLR